MKKKEEAEEAVDAGAAKEPLKTYYGETHCSARERGAQHVRDYQNKEEDSHMFKHFSDSHRNEKIEDIKFGMSVVKQHYSAFSRQIMESVLIFLDPHVLNSKSGLYNRCQVPRLSVMVGDQVASDQNHAKYDQVELDTELANIRNKHHLPSSADVTRPNKRQKRWHVNKERNKKKKDKSEETGESSSLEPNVVSPTLPQSSSENVAPLVVTKDSDPNRKLFPIFNSHDKSNENSNFKPRERIEASNINLEENPSLNSSVGAAKKKNKLKSTAGNNSIIKFLTPLRGKVPAKPNSSDPP